MLSSGLTGADQESVQEGNKEGTSSALPWMDLTPPWTSPVLQEDHEAATRPQRFQFVFLPKHGSWLNLVENLFSKMTRTMLREIRVKSKTGTGGPNPSLLRRTQRLGSVPPSTSSRAARRSVWPPSHAECQPPVRD